MPSSTAATGRHDDSPVAVLLPGSGYTAQAPLLAWSAALLAERGWHVEVVRWVLDDEAEADPGAFVEREATGAAEAARASGARGPLHVVAKSLGTLALPWAVRVGVPGAWLTPLSTEPALRGALAAAGPEHLLVGGGDDGWWRPDELPATRAEVVTVPGADHGLTLTTSWRASLAAHADVFERVDAWAAARVAAVAAR